VLTDEDDFDDGEEPEDGRPQKFEPDPCWLGTEDVEKRAQAHEDGEDDVQNQKGAGHAKNASVLGLLESIKVDVTKAADLMARDTGGDAQKEGGNIDELLLS